MEDIQLLQKVLESEFGKRSIEATPIPDFVTANLNQNFQIRPYQQRAFQYFITYWNEVFEGKPDKHQLLFHMATGSGKTLMMAGLILYLYDQGYRNFLFFVNSTNIIGKTRDNFLNDSSIKYLFNKSISKADKKVSIREVQNFQTTNDDCINIVFSTIQGLHTGLNNPKENSITFDDFEDKKIVLISDEAHHINVETKAGLGKDMFGEVTVNGKVSKEEAEELISWESTVNKIFNAHPQNILLEFTATINLSNEYIAEKYAKRLLFDYPLKQFRIDGYSKDVKVLQTDAGLFDRALQAVLLSQYRRKVFEKYHQPIKPVILFKSKTIADSNTFHEQFIASIKSLTVEKLLNLKNHAAGVLLKVFHYIEHNHISLENLVSELKVDFSEEKTISVNSKEESDEKQIAINTLEDPNNEYRAIFAVDKLNEGWDVLNLFDIVRLYDTRDAKNNKPGETTVKEAQLIGRGARYCPFKLSNAEEASKRKFDMDLENEMRICEELYYHSSYNPRYIQELNSALIKTGLLPDTTVTRHVQLKPEFTRTKFYQYGQIHTNSQVKYTREEITGFPTSVINRLYKVPLRTGYNVSSNLFDKQSQEGLEKKEKDFKLKDFNKTIIKKAVYKLEFYSFLNLKRLFPSLESIDELITNNNYLGDIRLNISGLASQLDVLSPDDILNAVIQVLEEISLTISGTTVEYKGSREFTPLSIKETITDKYLTFAANESEDREFGKSMTDSSSDLFLDLHSKSWHVFNDSFGTSEEKYFIKYIDKIYDLLKEQYDEIYLIRNERYFKLYNFEDGKAIEPDFVLFLSKKNQTGNLYYQIFIEPKGKHLKATDQWKEDFLISIKSQHTLKQIWKDKEYIIWGMPFFNHDEEINFSSRFSQEVGI